MFGRLFPDRMFPPRMFPNGVGIIIPPVEPPPSVGGGGTSRRRRAPQVEGQVVHALVDCELPALECEVLGRITAPVHGVVSSAIGAIRSEVHARVVPATVRAVFRGAVPALSSSVLGTVRRPKALSVDNDEQILMEHYLMTLSTVRSR